MWNGLNPTPRNVSLPFNTFTYPIESYAVLPSPEYDSSKNYFEVAYSRKSTRSFRPLTLKEVSNVLWLTAKVKAVKVANDGVFLSHRPSASAGGIHPIDTLVSTPAPLDVRSLYYYDPYLHRLCTLSFDKRDKQAFFEHVNSCLAIGDATILWFVAHVDRTRAKYENADSLIWRDSGALIHCAQLNCTALNINSCAVGTLAEPFVSVLFEGKNTILSAGGILIG